MSDVVLGGLMGIAGAVAGSLVSYWLQALREERSQAVRQVVKGDVDVHWKALKKVDGGYFVRGVGLIAASGDGLEAEARMHRGRMRLICTNVTSCGSTVPEYAVVMALPD